MSISEAELVPYTDTLRQECPRIRILVVGKSGAGKSALINAVFGLNATSVSHKAPGSHDIDKPLSFPSNDRIIIHDSKGFEAGEEANIQKVLDFIERRSNMTALGDQLHAIWICAEIPFSGSRLFEAGVERILTEYRKRVPIIVVFTKLDILREHREKKLEEQLEQQDEEMEDEEFEAKLDDIVNAAVQELCSEPLRAITPAGCPEYSCFATSTGGDPRFKKTITELVSLALDVTKIENIWIEMAIAQRSNAEVSIKASIRIGRKHYWRGLFSDLFLGHSMRKLLNVLRRDIVNAWNMLDPENHLEKPDFLALISVLVEDLSEKEINNYPVTQQAVKMAIEQPPLYIVATAPAVIVILFAEWVAGTYKKTKSSLRCMAAFIVDLTLTMDTLFYLVLSHGQKPLTVGLVNRALKIYKTRKASVHHSIRAWAEDLGTFTHLDADVVISKIEDIIMEHSVKPKEWATRDEGADEAWMSADALRET